MSDRRAEQRIWLALAAFILIILGLGVVSLLRDDPDSRLPVLATVPDFALIGTDGEKVSRSDFDGGLWVADFIFTQCAGVCPVLSARMAEIQKQLDDGGIDAKLVSISVDPARDSPQAMRAYSERFGADPERWRFLTGDRAALHQLIGKGFQLAIAERSPEEAEADGGELITHSDRFVLVDRNSRIRGYYHGTDRESVAQLVEDLTSLAER